MKYTVLTLFPEMIEQGMGTSITGRAMSKGLIELKAVNIRDYSDNKHMKVDDYPYGMFGCIRSINGSMGVSFHRICTWSFQNSW